MAGPSVLMPAATRLIAPERRGIAFGVVNAGGSFGQFLIAPIAGMLMLSLRLGQRDAGAGAAWCCCRCPRPSS